MVPVDEFVKFLVANLPNFAGLIVCVAVLVWVIVQQQKQIARQQARIDELCGDETPDLGETDT